MTHYAYTAAQCREIDQIAMQALNLSGLQLMHRAAEAALAVVLERWPSVRRISLYCGPGNNGGDGYLLAEKAHKLGFTVNVWAVLPPASDLAKAASAVAQKRGLEIQTLSDEPRQCFDPHAELIVDAIFGHGLTRPVDGHLAGLVGQLNQSNIPMLALDIPSGINSDTGAVMGVAVNADASCSFIVGKPGLLTAEGPDYAGTIYQRALGVSSRIYEGIGASFKVIDQVLLKHLMPVPLASSHKGDFGHVGVIGGHSGMVGAAIMAALAAARSGAGKVTVLTDKSHIHLIQQANPVLMTQNIAADGALQIDKSINALALGPGLGCELSGAQHDLHSWSLSVFESTLQQAIARDLPMVVDADALTLLAQFPREYRRWVLTPHPKEAATLLGVTVQAIQADRPTACRQIVQRYGGVCVLKGNGSLVSDGSAQLAICTAGNWGMATGGSGDVLSGIIGALLAAGLDGYSAARLAVEIHAQAGDLAVAKLAKRSMIATDLIGALAGVFNQLEKA